MSPPFAAMAAYPQWIIWKAVAGKTPGKVDKLPCDWRTFDITPRDSGGAQNEQFWLPYEAAIGLAAACGPPYGYGFVFTKNDPFWFLDIDNALQSDGIWSPLAIQLCQRFAGAAVEVSQSGRGLHIFGTGTVPAHGCKNTALGLEFYTEGRFAAMTGNGAVGDSGASFDLTSFVTEYFPPSAATATAAPVAWVDAAVPEWSGPLDDDDLIAQACASRSGAAAFGGKASFRDLWENNVEVLSRHYPESGNQRRPYDSSAADAALAQHLAWWTGKNPARMERLMRGSSLARDKWDDYRNGATWLAGLIEDQIGRCTSVRMKAVEPGGGLYKPVPSLTDVGASVTTIPMGRGTGSGTDDKLLVSDINNHFAGCVYIERSDVIAVPDGSLLNQIAFRKTTRYGGHTFPYTPDYSKTTKDAWIACVENSKKVYVPLVAERAVFRPELPSWSIIEKNGEKLFNTYYPIDTPAEAGDVGPFLDLLSRMFPHEPDRLQLIVYLAACVQYAGHKFPWCVVIQGVQGGGKSTLFEIMEHCLHETRVHRMNPNDLDNKFNSAIQGKTLLVIEEIFSHDKAAVHETLKILITNRTIEIQAKGKDQISGDNRANLLLSTNHKNAILKDKNDRRFCIFFTAQQEVEDFQRDGMTEAWFGDLRRWLLEEGGLRYINHYLKTYPIPYELNPAGGMRRAPVTQATAEAIELNEGVVELTLKEAIINDEEGFRGHFISSHHAARILYNLSRRAPANKYNTIMNGIGYVRHPLLKDGRTNTPVGQEGKRSILWVRRGSIPHLNATTAAEVARMYCEANGYPMNNLGGSYLRTA